MRRLVLFFTLLGIALGPLHAQVVIKMEQEGGVFTIPCKVNGLPMKMIFDTGADHVSISLTEALFMIKNELLKESDIIGTTYSQIANGDIVDGTEIVIREIEIGGIKINNITADVSHTLTAPILLGQSAIQKLGPIQLRGNELIIDNGTKPKSDEEAVKKYWTAYQMNEAEHYDEAIAAAIEGIALADGSRLKASLYGELASAYSGKNQVESAIEAYRTASVYDPTNMQNNHNLGVELINSGRFQQAYKAFEDQIRFSASCSGSPEDKKIYLAGAYQYLALIDFDRGNIINAEKNALKSLGYMEVAGTYFLLGDIYKEKEQYEQAIDNYNKGIAFNPTSYSNIENYSNLGFCYMNINQNEKAKEAFMKCFELYSNYANVMNEMPDGKTAAVFNLSMNVYAHLCTVTGDYHKAIITYELIAEHEADIDDQLLFLLYNDLITCYSAINDKSKLSQTIEKGLDRLPNNGDFLFRKALLTENHTDAIMLYKQILEHEADYTPLAFDYSTVYNNIAWSYYLLGRYSEALPYAEKSVSMNANHAYGWGTNGHIYYSLGRYQDCINAMQHCIDLNQYLKEAYEFIGKSKIALGMKKEGNRDLQKAKEYKD